MSHDEFLCDVKFTSQQEKFWLELRNRFNVDLGTTILGDAEDSDEIVSIKWKIFESKTPGHSRVEFRRACDGKLHMPGAPAIVYEDGSKLYYQNGFLHNPRGPAKILVLSSGTYCEYYLYGMLTGTNGNCIGESPKQLPSIPHLPGEPVANKNDHCWKS